MGNFIELEKTYDLMYSFSDSTNALPKALYVLRDAESKRMWAKKREKVIRDKIDLTAYMVRFVEKYSHSYEKKELQETSKNI
jgi:predicted glycosyltransferase